MSTPRTNYQPKVIAEMLTSELFGAEPFYLVDVGASGGIEALWHVFKPCLRGVGFDPLVKECERLNREDIASGIRYIDAFVGAEGIGGSGPMYPDKDSTWGVLPDAYSRSSAARALEIAGYSFTKRFNNDDADIVFSNRRLSLDSFLLGEGVDSVDFIKVDTDGYDYEVLLGAKDTLARRGVLGVFVECQFHGVVHEQSNVFANIDRLLREAGFSLFDLEAYRYTRGALPGRFVYELFAQTREGPVVWGDALYLRDYAAPGYANRWESFSTTKLLKLIALFELYGLYDCAAELLLQQRDLAFQGVAVDHWLDLLAQELEPSSKGYADHMRKFSDDPRSFFPSPATAAVRSALPKSVLAFARRIRNRLAR
jgi:FkbM family methyltransferase